MSLVLHHLYKKQGETRWCVLLIPLLGFSCLADWPSGGGEPISKSKMESSRGRDLTLSSDGVHICATHTHLGGLNAQW